jgi:hypothetical protein
VVVGEGDIAGGGDIAGEVVPDGDAAGSEPPPPQAPRVVAIPKAKTAAKTLVFITSGSSLQQIQN